VHHFGGTGEYPGTFNSKYTFFASKRKKFLFRFASFCFEAKMMGVFAFFRFVFASFHFRFTSDFYVSKHFFRIEANKILLPFRFISLRSENDGAPYFCNNNQSAWKRGPAAASPAPHLPSAAPLAHPLLSAASFVSPFYLALHQSWLRFQLHRPLRQLLHSLLPYPHM
jgi:hypothetical protein